MSDSHERGKDSVIGDVRRARRELLARHRGDLRELVRRLRKEQDAHRRKVVDLRGRRAKPARGAKR